MSNDKQKYKYIGEDSWFIKNGDIIEAHVTTWSIAIPNPIDRTTLKCIDFDGVGFNGETLSINLDKFEEIQGGNK